MKELNQNVKKLTYKKVVICGICCALAIVGVLWNSFSDKELKNTIYEGDMAWNKQTATTCHVEKNQVCAKEFLVQEPAKDISFDVRIITWNKKYTNSYLLASLWKSKVGGELVGELKISTKELVDQKNQKFLLSDVNIEAGKYVIGFTSNEEIEPIGLGVTRDQEGKEYIKNGKKIKNSDLKILIKQ